MNDEIETHTHRSSRASGPFKDISLHQLMQMKREAVHSHSHRPHHSPPYPPHDQQHDPRSSFSGKRPRQLADSEDGDGYGGGRRRMGDGGASGPVAKKLLSRAGALGADSSPSYRDGPSPWYRPMSLEPAEREDRGRHRSPRPYPGRVASTPWPYHGRDARERRGAADDRDRDLRDLIAGKMFPERDSRGHRNGVHNGVHTASNGAGPVSPSHSQHLHTDGGRGPLRFSGSTIGSGSRAASGPGGGRGRARWVPPWVKNEEVQQREVGGSSGRGAMAYRGHSSKGGTSERGRERGGEGEGASEEGKGTNLFLRKTTMCRHWLKGMCALGSNCEFAHSKEELRKKPDWFKTKRCKYFRRGQCRDPNCGFAHYYDERRPLVAAPPQFDIENEMKAAKEREQKRLKV
ncbi:unnamed protein product, partial [Vitrella brassicaformis CCMP3155]